MLKIKKICLFRIISYIQNSSNAVRAHFNELIFRLTRIPRDTK